MLIVIFLWDGCETNYINKYLYVIVINSLQFYNHKMNTYGYTILYVENVEETLAFYVKAFGFKQKFLTPEKDYGELDTGGTILSFASYSIAAYNGISVAKSDLNTTPAPFEIAFVADDIEQTWKRAVNAGAAIVKEPTQKPWGQVVGYLRDKNGFLIEVCTRVG
jgi:uncharacterized glyoxalase superfamily protein PhnB